MGTTADNLAGGALSLALPIEDGTHPTTVAMTAAQSTTITIAMPGIRPCCLCCWLVCVRILKVLSVCAVSHEDQTV
jgi:hypothetical protein